MEEEKKRILARKSIEELLKLDRRFFTKSECQEIIDETRLTKLDRDIANMKVMECLTFDEIAERLLRDKRTISARWEKISYGLRLTVIKLAYRGHDLFDIDVNV